MSDTKSELHRIVKGFVDDLEAAVAGMLYCDEHGNYLIIDDMDGWKEERYEEMAEDFRKDHPESNLDREMYDSYEDWMEDEIGTADDIDEPDEVSLGEYINKQSLGDMHFEVDTSMDISGGKVLFCYGGPNVWVFDDKVCGYWGFDTVEMSLDSATSSALYSWFEDEWELVKESQAS